MKILRFFRVKVRRLAKPLRRRVMLLARAPLNHIDRLVPYYFLIIGLCFASLLAVEVLLWVLKVILGISLDHKLVVLVLGPVYMLTLVLILIYFDLAYRAWRLDALKCTESCIFCGYRAMGLSLAGKVSGFHRCPECGELIVTEPYVRPNEGEYLRKEAEEAVVGVKNYQTRHTMPIKTLKLFALCTSFGALAVCGATAYMLVLDHYYPGVMFTPLPLEFQPPKIFMIFFGTAVFGVPLAIFLPFMIMGVPLLLRVWHVRRISPLIRKERTELFLEFEERVKQGVSLPKAPEKGIDQSGKKTALGVRT